MIDTVFYSLVFDYNIKTMETSGRHWASTAYKNKDYIFGYSAASISTVLHHNPTIDYRVMTDDPDLLTSKLKEYDVSFDRLPNFSIIDARSAIEGWKSDRYCFWPLIISMDTMIREHGSSGKRVVKLDNDLTCLKPLDERFYSHRGSHVWKFERMCSSGRDYWGEKMVAQKAFGTDKFRVFNTGIWSIDPDHATLSQEIPDLVRRSSDVDISSIHYFPDKPGVVSKTWSCSDQTSNNFWLHKNQIDVLETHEWFFHHCYVTNKEGVFKEAEYLKKRV